MQMHDNHSNQQNDERDVVEKSLKRPEIIFGQGANRWNACIDNYINFSQLARYYLESANALIERSVEHSSKLDVYIYSALFLYRHSIELLLKDLIWTSSYLLGKGKTFPKHHRLMELWETLKANAHSLLKSDFPMKKKELQYIKTILVGFTKYDLKSDSFRYPFDKNMKRPHSDIHHINVKHLYEQLNLFHENFETLSNMIECLYDEHIS